MTANTRAAIEEIIDTDRRIRFLDYKKGPHHGEIHRNTAIHEAVSPNIFYLSDDDLFLPDHVADLLCLLKTANFVQSRNGCFNSDGTLWLYPTNLADPESISWHLRLPPRNRVSLTGTAHSREFYMQLDRGWETTPVGYWPDHFMWMKFFNRPEFKGATSSRMTALQFPHHLRHESNWSDGQILAEFLQWVKIVESDGGQEKINELANQAAHVAVQWLDRELNLCQEKLWETEQRLQQAERRVLYLSGLQAEASSETDSLN